MQGASESRPGHLCGAANPPGGLAHRDRHLRRQYIRGSRLGEPAAEDSVGGTWQWGPRNHWPIGACVQEKMPRALCCASAHDADVMQESDLADGLISASAATTPEDAYQQINLMLSRLGDPFTRIIPPRCVEGGAVSLSIGACSALCAQYVLRSIVTQKQCILQGVSGLPHWLRWRDPGRGPDDCPGRRSFLSAPHTWVLAYAMNMHAAACCTPTAKHTRCCCHCRTLQLGGCWCWRRSRAAQPRALASGQGTR